MQIGVKMRIGQNRLIEHSNGFHSGHTEYGMLLPGPGLRIN